MMVKKIFLVLSNYFKKGEKIFQLLENLQNNFFFLSFSTR